MKTKLTTTLLILALTSSAFSQGLLTPPPTGGQAVGVAGPLGPSGEPMPTMKTLHQIEPRHDLLNGPWGVGDVIVDISDSRAHYVIKKPGSYYLSNNLVVAKQIGILIEAENVTLDLNGFRISGPGATEDHTGNTGIEIGDSTGDAPASARIINGQFSDLQLAIIGYASCVIKDLRIERCSAAVRVNKEGADVEMSDCRIMGCGTEFSSVIYVKTAMASLRRITLSSCTAYRAFDLLSQSAGTLVECEIASCNIGDHGFMVEGCSLTRCHALNSGVGDGFFAINCVLDGCTVISCKPPTGFGRPIVSAAFNLIGSTSTGCKAIKNQYLTAFGAYSGSELKDCLAHEHMTYHNEGIIAAAFDLGGATASRCKVDGMTANEGDSFTAFSLESSTAVESIVTNVAGNAFYCTGQATVSACHVFDVKTGLEAAANCILLLKDSVFQKIEGVAIETEGSHGQIEGNILTDFARGIRVTGSGTGNLIIRNQLKNASVSHWNIQSGNRVGQIIRASTTATFFGNGIGTGFVSTDPWANHVD